MSSLIEFKVSDTLPYYLFVVFMIFIILLTFIAMIMLSVNASRLAKDSNTFILNNLLFNGNPGQNTSNNIIISVADSVTFDRSIDGTTIDITVNGKTYTEPNTKVTYIDKTMIAIYPPVLDTAFVKANSPFSANFTNTYFTTSWLWTTVIAVITAMIFLVELIFLGYIIWNKGSFQYRTLAITITTILLGLILLSLGIWNIWIYYVITGSPSDTSSLSGGQIVSFSLLLATGLFLIIFSLIYIANSTISKKDYEESITKLTKEQKNLELQRLSYEIKERELVQETNNAFLKAKKEFEVQMTNKCSREKQIIESEYTQHIDNLNADADQRVETLKEKCKEDVLQAIKRKSVQLEPPVTHEQQVTEPVIVPIQVQLEAIPSVQSEKKSLTPRVPTLRPISSTLEP